MRNVNLDHKSWTIWVSRVFPESTNQVGSALNQADITTDESSAMLDANWTVQVRDPCTRKMLFKDQTGTGPEKNLKSIKSVFQIFFMVAKSQQLPLVDS